VSTISSPLAALDLEDGEDEAMEADEQVEPAQGEVDSSCVHPDTDADVSVAHTVETGANSSVVQHDEDEEGAATSEADESRLTELTRDGEEGGDEEEEGEEDSVVNLSRLTEDYGGGEGEISREDGVSEAEEGEEEEDDLEGVEDEEEEPEADDQSDFAPSPIRPRSPSKKTASTPGPSSSSPSKRTPAPSSQVGEDESFDTFSPVKTPGGFKHGKENEAPVPLEMSTPVNFDGPSGGDGEVDEFGERSMVIKSGSKSKKKTRYVPPLPFPSLLPTHCTDVFLRRAQKTRWESSRRRSGRYRQLRG
jgi:hypothetical protein